MANVVGVIASTPYITLSIVFSLVLGAHRDQTEQHLVALGGELVDRLAVRLFEDALDDLLLKVRGEFWVAQPWPPRGEK